MVLGVGVEPNDHLAREAGLETNNGIVVDGHLRTADPDIFAIGDCTSFPSVQLGAHVRLESVQNATDQGRHVAEVILGLNEPYTELPWFWSTQGAIRLQIAHVPLPEDETVLIGDVESTKFSILCFRDGSLAAVESINSPGDHMAARKLLCLANPLMREDVEADGFSLRGALKKKSSSAS